jgi:hypothetical protein
MTYNLEWRECIIIILIFLIPRKSTLHESLNLIYFYFTLLISTILVIEELSATGKFEFMDLSVDEAEHSMEMHLPYLAKVFQG